MGWITTAPKWSNLSLSTQRNNENKNNSGETCIPACLKEMPRPPTPPHPSPRQAHSQLQITLRVGAAPEDKLPYRVEPDHPSCEQ